MNKSLIMIVDDDLDVLSLYSVVGDIEDANIAIADGGFSALKWLERFNYNVDAVVIDLSMPDVDGLTLTKLIRSNEAIRSKTHPIKLFWFTGWEINDTLANAKTKYGVREIFEKPMAPIDLVHKVKEMLNAGG
jgi:CheY-like chemotaxis protein